MFEISLTYRLVLSIRFVIDSRIRYSKLPNIRFESNTRNSNAYDSVQGDSQMRMRAVTNYSAGERQQLQSANFCSMISGHSIRIPCLRAAHKFVF